MPDSGPSVRIIALCALASLGAAVLFGACRGGGSPKDAGGSPSGSQGTTPGASGATKGTFDVVLTGALQAEWKSGQQGASMSCVVSTEAGANVLVSGQVASKQYGLVFRQDESKEGTFAYPAKVAAGTSSPGYPFVQISTSSDASVDWTASVGGGGNGSVTTKGGADPPLAVTVDLDLTPRSGAVVHIKGTIQCPVQSN